MTRIVGLLTAAAMPAVALSGGAVHASPRKSATLSVEFTAVAAVPGSADAWVLGSLTKGTSPYTVLAHHHGKHWTTVKLKDDPTVDTISAIAAGTSKVWVGGSHVSGGLVHLAIWHFNGKKLVAESLPMLGAGRLTGLVASSDKNAWAVGYQTAPAGSSGYVPVSLHWNGKRWTRQPVLNEPSNLTLNSITTSASNNAWAMGGGLILHWGGSKWTKSPYTPLDPGAEAIMKAVATSASNKTYLIGTRQDPNADAARLYAARWNGSKWATSKTPLTDDVVPLSIAAHGSLVVAVGNRPNGKRTVPMTAVFKGGKWTFTKAPAVGTFSRLLAVSAGTAKTATAVGQSYPSATKVFPSKGLIETYNGHKWKRVTLTIH